MGREADSPALDSVLVENHDVALVSDFLLRGCSSGCHHQEGWIGVPRCGGGHHLHSLLHHRHGCHEGESRGRNACVDRHVDQYAGDGSVGYIAHREVEQRLGCVQLGCLRHVVEEDTGHTTQAKHRAQGGHHQRPRLCGHEEDAGSAHRDQPRISGFVASFHVLRLYGLHRALLVLEA